ncbi:hypothetical protein [Chamaesiphon sp. VAR_48_metabat_403]|uniref:hypothetical protein n=1 Tax=Chamaesiphon sp. VAR_48_metabat_403 TaxID=2964700 RepID=UPI00286D737C|nr:hypothetical protein [Chamaesiphon sp. VAR_48_metabat_403]
MEATLIATQSSNLLTVDRQNIEGIATDPTFAIVSSMAILTAIAVSSYAYVSTERQKNYSRKPCDRTPCHSCE